MANRPLNKFLSYRVLESADQRLIEDNIPHSVLVLDNNVKENTLLAGNEDGTISVWNTRELRKEDTIDAGTAACISLNYACDTLITQDHHGIVRFFVPRESSWVETDLVRLDFDGGVKADVVNEMKGLVVCPKKNSIVEIYSMKTGSKVAALIRDTASLGDIAAIKVANLKSGPNFIVAYKNGEIRVWDFRMLHPQAFLRHSDSLTALDFCEGTRDGLYATRTGVVVFKIDYNCQFIRDYPISGVNSRVDCVRMRPDNRGAALGCPDGQIHTIAWKSYRKASVLTEHTAEIHDICFSSDSKFMVAAGNDGKISIMNSHTFPKFVA